MKKIPTLFKRQFDDRGNLIGVLPEVTKGLEWVLRGEGEATEKVDGSCCAIIDGSFYRRYDVNIRKGRKPPAGSVPCQEAPDEVTGHWPHWMRVTVDDPAAKWYVAAYENTPWNREDWTYEAVGPHFQNNPYGLDEDFLERHGRIAIKDPLRSFEEIREWLRNHEVEGIVWWKDGEPRCKIKRSDFGFKWPVRRDV